MSTHLRLDVSILLDALFSGILGWFLINGGSKYAGNRIENQGPLEREFVSKPVRGAELAQIVRELLDGKEPETA